MEEAYREAKQIAKEPHPARRTDKPVWQPQYHKDGRPTPQVLASQSAADTVGFGGAAGGGKTDLLLGLAGTEHHRAIIFRRESPRLEGIIARSKEIYEQDPRNKLNESLHRWKLDDGARTVQLAYMQYEDDKFNFQGRPYDFYGFDEVTEFTESQFRFVTGWNRTTKPGQRCRVVLTFNPPMDESQDWVTNYFGPWLKEDHPKPAKDGELRWYAMIKGVETEVESGEPFLNDAGRMVAPKSRTFFHSYLSDNPLLEETGYDSTIDAMPEPLRSILRGNFQVGRVADPFQVIPVEWVKAAQARWAAGKPMVEGENDPVPIKQTALGGDVARGGGDCTVIAPLYGTWFDEILKYPGKATPSGQVVAALLLQARKDESRIGVDVIGVGASVFDSLQMAGIDVLGINFGAGTKWRDKSGKLLFRNVRAAAYWCLREALDPDNNTDVALPPDPELLADLCAPKWGLSVGKVTIEEKAEIIKRIGRSPDKGDAVVYAWWAAYGMPSGASLVSFG
jgi:hypothetical protein